MQNRVFTPFLLRFWKLTMKSESFSNAVLHFDKFYLKYRKQKRFEQWRTHAVCCRHLPTTTFGIFWECSRFLDQKEIFKKRCQNSLNVNLHSWNTELKKHLIYTWIRWQLLISYSFYFELIFVPDKNKIEIILGITRFTRITRFARITRFIRITRSGCDKYLDIRIFSDTNICLYHIRMIFLIQSNLDIGSYDFLINTYLDIRSYCFSDTNIFDINLYRFLIRIYSREKSSLRAKKSKS